jgi:hypothetical protein
MKKDWEKEWQEGLQRIANFPEKIRSAHDRCSNHRQELLNSAYCGCFYCLAIFEPARIKEWIDEGQTAMCPECGIDSVIGDASGFSITQQFLKEMNSYWFSA